MDITNARGWQFTQLENNRKTIVSLVGAADAGALTTFRDGGTGWTVLEVLCHLRDFELVFLERARLTVEQDEPPLPFPNPDETAAANRYSEQNVSTVLDEWQANRATMTAYLRERAESDWQRVGVHPVRGRLTLFEQLLLCPTHDSIHLEQMARILHEKQG